MFLLWMMTRNLLLTMVIFASLRLCFVLSALTTRLETELAAAAAAAAAAASADNNNNDNHHGGRIRGTPLSIALKERVSIPSMPITSTSMSSSSSSTRETTEETTKDSAATTSSSTSFEEQSEGQQDSSKESTTTTTSPDSTPSNLPNIIVVLTDDLDWTLGGWNASTLEKTRRIMLSSSSSKPLNNNNNRRNGSKNKDKDRNNDNSGVLLTNWFAQTPVCCPSRAELLTGRYFHNLWTSKDIKGSPGSCMHVHVEGNNSDCAFYQDYYFAKYFQQRYGYTVGIFGKHLNTANPTNFIPDGIDVMLVNNGGQYYDPAFRYAVRNSTSPSPVSFDNCTSSTSMPCYSTSVIANTSLAWIERHLEQQQQVKQEQQQQVKQQQQQPFFALISVKAPHVQDGTTPPFAQAFPAPWYNDTYLPEQNTSASGAAGPAPRTENYNVSCPNHHWVVRTQAPITQEQGKHIDDLYISRLRSLLSVDDLMVELKRLLQRYDDDGDDDDDDEASTTQSGTSTSVWDNTYIVFTSDNGFQLGQYRLPCCKLQPYENDIRIPMMIRGPGIRRLEKQEKEGEEEVTVPQQQVEYSQSIRADVIGTHVDLMPTLMGLIEEASSQSSSALSSVATTTVADDDDVSQDSFIPSTMDGSNLAPLLLQRQHLDLYSPKQDMATGGTITTAASATTNTTRTTTTEPFSEQRHRHTHYIQQRHLLIEYMSLGDVERYQHLIDTHNNTFLALRVLVQSINVTETETESLTATTTATTTTLKTNNNKNKDNSSKERSRRRSTTISTLRDYKYIEFRDSQVDWNATQPYLERELYDLQTDPFELNNLMMTVRPDDGTGTGGGRGGGGGNGVTSAATGTTSSSIPFPSNVVGTTNATTEFTITGSFLQRLHEKMMRLLHCQGDVCRKESISITKRRTINDNFAGIITSL